MTKKLSYSPLRQGPTLLWYFQTYVSEGDIPEEAATRLTDEIKTGKIEVPELKPGARLEPKEGERRPHLIVDKVNRTKTASEKFYYGLPRLDVVDTDGTRTPAENFYGRRCSTLPPPPPPYIPPPTVSEPTAQTRKKPKAKSKKKARKKLKPKPEEKAVEKPAVEEKPKVEEPKVERKLVTRYMSWESQTWKKIIPYLQTLKLQDLNEAYHAVDNWAYKNKLTMAKSTIYDGLKRHRDDWQD